MNYIVTIGKDGFTEKDIREGMNAHDGYGVHFDDGIFDQLVIVMREQWATFPADRFINETSPDIWMRKEEAIECAISRILVMRQRGGM
jgi:hypothetical protein